MKNIIYLLLPIMLTIGCNKSDIVESEHKPCSNEIWYTSTDGNIVTPYDSNVFGANIVSNTYENGKGVIKFDGDVTEIGEKAFYDSDSLTSIIIPDSVTEIGSFAFEYCSSLTSITIPDSVTTIESYTFCGCSSLTSVTIGNSVTKIGWRAFDSCSSLKEFKGKFAADGGRCLIKDNTIIAYANASGTTYTIPYSVTTIGSSAFEDCSSLTSITIPDSVTEIGGYAFECCSSLTSVTIGDSVTVIGTQAFIKCSSLTSVTIGNSVTKIGWHAFDSCSSLTTITIPDSVTTIGGSAFYGCSSLKSVYCSPQTPPTAEYESYSSWYAFDDNASGRKIYVPVGSGDAYKKANGWKDYADAIEEKAM